MRERLAVALLLTVLASAGCDRPPPPDLLIIGHVWTGDSLTPRAEAVAVQGDRIVYVGDSAGALKLGHAARIIRGAFVSPGFGDSHVHLIDGGSQLASVDLRSANSPEEFTRRIKEYVATLHPGEWVLNGMWDHEAWGGQLPDRSWIDSVTPDNPVFVSRLDGHMGLANSAALRAAGLGKEAPAIAGGTIVRRADGQLSGVLKDEAMGPIFSAIPALSPAQADSSVQRATSWAAAHGVTTLDALSVSWLDYAALLRAQQAGRLLTRVHVYFPLSQWQRVAGVLKKLGPGEDEFLWIGGVKGFVDGSLGSTTAWFDEPYLDSPGERGFLTTPAESLAAWIGAADSARMQVVVHAIGDRGNALLLDIYDSVATAHGPRDRRFRVEHAQHLRPADIPRFASQHVIPSMQPYHVADDGRWADKRIGPERSRTTYAFRSLLDSGARLSFGSDWTVAPLDPLLGMQAAVTRQTLDGKHPGRLGTGAAHHGGGGPARLYRRCGLRSLPRW